jgi:hypothetical protein
MFVDSSYMGQNVNVDNFRQAPFLVGGTIRRVIMTYYYGLLFSLVVNSAIWYVKLIEVKRNEGPEISF